MVEMKVEGLTLDPLTNMPIIILKDSTGGKALPIWVGYFEANAIALEIENISTPRPMTHDLLKNLILNFKQALNLKQYKRSVKQRKRGLQLLGKKKTVQN